MSPSLLELLQRVELHDLLIPAEVLDEFRSLAGAGILSAADPGRLDPAFYRAATFGYMLAVSDLTCGAFQPGNSSALNIN